MRTHGTISCYRSGCHCSDCQRASREHRARYRKPGPCLFAGTDKCGIHSSYTTRKCRGDACHDAMTAYGNLRGKCPFDAVVSEGRLAGRGLQVIDVNAHHPARARWAALIAKLEDVA